MFLLEKRVKKFGTRCEIKNVNSIKFMEMAIESEAKRQIELLESEKNTTRNKVV